MQRYEELIGHMTRLAGLSSRNRSEDDVDGALYEAAEAITALCGDLEEALEALRDAEKLHFQRLLFAELPSYAKHKEKKDG